MSETKYDWYSTPCIKVGVTIRQGFINGYRGADPAEECNASIEYAMFSIKWHLSLVVLLQLMRSLGSAVA